MRRFFVLMFTLFALLTSQYAAANSFQYWWPETFKNPATMDKVKGSHVESGVFIPRFYQEFTGRVGATHGHVKGHKVLYLPYNLFAHRLGCRFVGGIDLTNPLLFYTVWPSNSFVRPLGFEALTNTFEVSPKLSYKINDHWAIGASLRYVNIIDAQLNYTVLNRYVFNRGKASTYGCSVGVMWTYSPKWIIDLSYFSRIQATIRGTSISNTTTNRAFHTNSFIFGPDCGILNIMHIYNRKFLMNLKVTYSYWHPNKKLLLNNVAAGLNPTILITKQKNIWHGSLYGRYQTGGRAAIFGAVGYDEALTRTAQNSPAFPTGTVYFFSGGGEYRFSKAGWLSLQVGQGRSHSPKIGSPPGIAKGSWFGLYTWIDAKARIDF